MKHDLISIDEQTYNIEVLLYQMNKFQKYLVGTLFDEEQQQKKTNLSNMKAKDPFGNTRWKGAFTGGFEAGYKNTCGSKDGWAPSTFISSVYKRAQKTQRNIFDYMDKEDLGRESISNNISLTNNFQNIKNDTMNVSLQQSIGEKILSKLKKLGAHRNAPQNEQQLQQLFKIYAKEQEVAKPTYQLTDLTQPLTVGAIASHISNDDFIDAYEDFYRKVIREHTRQQTQEQISKRRQQNRIYFDFTKPLEQQPDYLRQIQEVEMNEQPRKRKKNLINQQSLKNIYAPAVLFKQFDKKQQIEKAPQQYDPYWKVRQYNQKTTHKDIAPTGFAKPLTAQKRGEMLGEVKLSNKFVTSQNSLSNRFISKQAKQTNLAVFFEDEKKNRRFHQYMEQMEGKKISSQLQYLSYEAAEKQRNQFETVYKTHRQQKAKPQYKNKKQAHKQSEQKSKQFKIGRRIESWRPQKLLCKRFNVMTPYVVPKQANKQLFYA